MRGAQHHSLLGTESYISANITNKGFTKRKTRCFLEGSEPAFHKLSSLVSPLTVVCEPGFTWELVRNADSQALSHNDRICIKSLRL